MAPSMQVHIGACSCQSKMVATCKNQQHDSRSLHIELSHCPTRHTLSGHRHIIAEAGRISTEKKEETIKQSSILHASGEPRPRW